MTLYVLGAPDGRVALMHLPNLRDVTRRRDRTTLLRKRSERGGSIGDVLFADVVVLGVSSTCGEVDEYEAAERLVEGEEIASDRIARPPEQDVRAISDWFVPPGDWARRLKDKDVGLYARPRPLAELRDRGYLPRPLCPSDNSEAYRAVVAMVAMAPRPAALLGERRRYDAASDPHGAATARWTDRQ